MPAINQAQILSLPDILASDRYVLNFGSVPGVGDTMSTLTLRCLDVTLPGFNNESFPVEIMGQTRMFRGRKRYQNNDINATFVEGVDIGVLGALRNWHENVVGTASGNSNGYIADYAVTAILEIYDTTGALADTATMYNVFPYNVPDLNLSSGQTAMMQVQSSFHCDYWVYNNTPKL